MNLTNRDRVSAALTELGWPRIEQLITEHDVHVMYKLIHDERAPETIRRLLTDRAQVSSRSTRATHNQELEVPRVKTEFARRSFLCRATRAWNQLPVTTRSSQSFSVFKTNVGKAK